MKKLITVALLMAVLSLSVVKAVKADCPCNSGNTLNCPDFDSQRDAQSCLLKCSGDPHGLDGDNDGDACESYDGYGNGSYDFDNDDSYKNPTSAPQPTLRPTYTSTPIPPTATPLPTSTPTETPTPTPTFHRASSTMFEPTSTPEQSSALTIAPIPQHQIENQQQPAPAPQQRPASEFVPTSGGIISTPSMVLPAVLVLLAMVGFGFLSKKE
jgi:hypothetical protein